MGGGGKPPQNAVFDYATAVSEAVLFAVILLILLGIGIGLPKRELFALRRPRSWPRAAGLIVLAYLATIAVSAVIDPFLHPGREQGLTPTGWEPRHAGAFVANFVVFVFVGPAVEELTFRGMGFRLLLRFGVPVAIVLVGVAFGLWHGLVDALPVLVFFGMCLAYVRHATRSVYPSMILHALFNGLALILSVAR